MANISIDQLYYFELRMQFSKKKFSKCFETVGLTTRDLVTADRLTGFVVSSLKTPSFKLEMKNFNIQEPFAYFAKCSKNMTLDKVIKVNDDNLIEILQRGRMSRDRNGGFCGCSPDNPIKLTVNLYDAKKATESQVLGGRSGRNEKILNRLGGKFVLNLF